MTVAKLTRNQRGISPVRRIYRKVLSRVLLYRSSLGATSNGVSVIEVLIALGMGAIIIASVGNALLSVKRVGSESAHREQAVAYAQQALEVVNEQRNTLFPKCNGTPGICTGGGQSCTIQLGYTSCWLSLPGVVGVPLPAVDPFTRVVTVKDSKQGDTGNNDSNVKQVEARVFWKKDNIETCASCQNGCTNCNTICRSRCIELTSILTAWKI